MGGARRTTPTPVLPHHRAGKTDAGHAARRMGPLHRCIDSGCRPEVGVNTMAIQDAQQRNWRILIREQATAAGVDLPNSTVDELALHLEDLYANARAEGADHQAAVSRAMNA